MKIEMTNKEIANEIRNIVSKSNSVTLDLEALIQKIEPKQPKGPKQSFGQAGMIYCHSGSYPKIFDGKKFIYFDGSKSYCERINEKWALASDGQIVLRIRNMNTEEGYALAEHIPGLSGRDLWTFFCCFKQLDDENLAIAVRKWALLTFGKTN